MKKTVAHQEPMVETTLHTHQEPMLGTPMAVSTDMQHCMKKMKKNTMKLNEESFLSRKEELHEVE